MTSTDSTPIFTFPLEGLHIVVNNLLKIAFIVPSQMTEMKMIFGNHAKPDTRCSA